jgi:hypothetical protein
VSDSQEQAAAEAEGFSTSPPPPDPAFPKWFTERPVALGGTKVYDLRCVRINSNEEEQQFLAVVNREDWILDAGTSPWGTKRRRALRFGRRAQSAAKGDD